MIRALEHASAEFSIARVSVFRYENKYIKKKNNMQGYHIHHIGVNICPASISISEAVQWLANSVFIEFQEFGIYYKKKQELKSFTQKCLSAWYFLNLISIWK